MPKPPAFLFYASDWLSNEYVKLMPIAAQGLYVRLMCHQCLEHSLPDALPLLARLLSVDIRKLKAFWKHIEPFIEPAEKPGRIRIRTMDQMHGNW